jgi:hypothetical protein
MNNMIFISISQFKTVLGLPTDSKEVQLVKNPNTGKLFVNTPKGNFKAQQAIDHTKPVRFMYESETLFAEGCLTNVTESNNIIAAL